MDNSPAYIITQYLIDQDELLAPDASSGDWKVYVGVLPDGVQVDHNAVGCFDTSPVKDGRLMIGTPIFHYGVQLLVRSSGYNEGYAKAFTLGEALDAVQNVEQAIGSTIYTINNVSQTTGVVVLGQEEGTKRREMFSVNLLVTLTEEI